MSKTALQEPVDTSPPAAPVDASVAPVDTPAIADPSTSRRGRGKPSTAEPIGASYEQAQKFAQGKGQHNRAPGSRELPATTWDYGRSSYTGAKCQGQLRSVYARITAPSERYGQAGKTSWTPVAIWCDGCATVWTKPIDPAEATRRRPGRW